MIYPTVITKTDEGWLFEWTAGTPPYQIWLNGLLLEDEITDEEYLCIQEGYEDIPPPIEILNDGDTIENQEYPPFITLQWLGNANAVMYEIQEYVNAGWIKRALIDEVGQGYYKYTTRSLIDASTAQWRVLSLDLKENEGTPLSFSVIIAKNPDPPEVEIEYTKPNIVVSVL